MGVVLERGSIKSDEGNDWKSGNKNSVSRVSERRGRREVRESSVGIGRGNRNLLNRGSKGK